MINDKAKSQLTQLSANEAEYTKMLEKLWIQACFQLLEDDTVVTCREKDVSLLQVAFQPLLTGKLIQLFFLNFSFPFFDISISGKLIDIW